MDDRKIDESGFNPVDNIKLPPKTYKTNHKDYYERNKSKSINRANNHYHFWKNTAQKIAKVYDEFVRKMGVVFVRKGNLWGVISLEMDELIPCVYDSIVSYSVKTGVAIVLYEGSCRTANKDGLIESVISNGFRDNKK